MKRISKEQLFSDFSSLGIEPGDTLLVRASLGAVGRIDGGAKSFIEALTEYISPEGTIVSLAFTDASFIKKPKIEYAFTATKKSYAGALPNAMLMHKDAYRSMHPMCSYVAIGRLAKEITKDHNENSPAYEPIRKIIEANGKSVLIGCVESSPGFTTTHLAEADLGLLRILPVFPTLKKTYYIDENGKPKIFKRKDPGLCSNSFYKFYSLYLKKELIRTGRVGNAYSIMAPAKECYEIELDTLRKDRKFNICDSKECWTCNAGRWDRIHHAPGFFARKAISKVTKYLKKS